MAVTFGKKKIETRACARRWVGKKWWGWIWVKKHVGFSGGSNVVYAHAFTW